MRGYISTSSITCSNQIANEHHAPHYERFTKSSYYQISAPPPSFSLLFFFKFCFVPFPEVEYRALQPHLYISDCESKGFPRPSLRIVLVQRLGLPTDIAIDLLAAATINEENSGNPYVNSFIVQWCSWNVVIDHWLAIRAIVASVLSQHTEAILARWAIVFHLPWTSVIPDLASLSFIYHCCRILGLWFLANIMITWRRNIIVVPGMRSYSYVPSLRNIHNILNL